MDLFEEGIIMAAADYLINSSINMIIFEPIGQPEMDHVHCPASEVNRSGLFGFIRPDRPAS